jgi:Uma2 family endonuclease
LYETRPNTEWILGGPVQTVSPQREHGKLQGELYLRLGPWADGRGTAATEWRFWIQPSGEEARYLIPDVAYLSYARLPQTAGKEADEPRIAPDAAFEILSPSVRELHVTHKIDVYLRAGTGLVAVIDPATRTIRLIDRDGERTLAVGDVFRHTALPGFTFDIAAYFATLDR